MPIKTVELKAKPIGRPIGKLKLVKRVPSSALVGLENDIRRTCEQNERRRAQGALLAEKYICR